VKSRGTAGIDVSLELSSVCVVDARGKIVKDEVARWSVLASGKFALKLFVDHDCAGIERDLPSGSHVI
jgi:hypothetical protein